MSFLTKASELKGQANDFSLALSTLLANSAVVAAETAAGMTGHFTTALNLKKVIFVYRSADSSGKAHRMGAQVQRVSFPVVDGVVQGGKFSVSLRARDNYVLTHIVLIDLDGGRIGIDASSFDTTTRDSLKVSPVAPTTGPTTVWAAPLDPATDKSIVVRAPATGTYTVSAEGETTEQVAAGGGDKRFYLQPDGFGGKKSITVTWSADTTKIIKSWALAPDASAAKNIGAYDKSANITEDDFSTYVEDAPGSDTYTQQVSTVIEVGANLIANPGPCQVIITEPDYASYSIVPQGQAMTTFANDNDIGTSLTHVVNIDYWNVPSVNVTYDGAELPKHWSRSDSVGTKFNAAQASFETAYVSLLDQDTDTVIAQVTVDSELYAPGTTFHPIALAADDGIMITATVDGAEHVTADTQMPFGYDAVWMYDRTETFASGTVLQLTASVDPNGNTPQGTLSFSFWATSTDGINWTSTGVSTETYSHTVSADIQIAAFGTVS